MRTPSDAITSDVVLFGTPIQITSDTQDSGLGSPFYRGALEYLAVASGGTVYTDTLRGYLDDTRSASDIIEGLIRQIVPTARVIVRGVRRKRPAGMSPEYSYAPNHEPSEFHAIWDRGYISLQPYHDDTVAVHIATMDQDVLNRLMDALNPLMEWRPRAHVHTVYQSDHGPRLLSVGLGGSPLERGNYSWGIQNEFDHIVSEIQNPDPCGRLILLTGPPGTGKTYFIEGVIHAQPNAKYVIVPPAIVPNLTSPDLIRVLVPEDVPMANEKSMPTVLIIEDADHCMVSRQADNLPAISTLLNLASGIVGRCLDIRVIATSNAKTTDIDPALKRSGRLCRSVNFDVLMRAHAVQVAQRLTGTDLGITQNTPLSDIYLAAKKDGLMRDPQGVV